MKSMENKTIKNEVIVKAITKYGKRIEYSLGFLEDSKLYLLDGHATYTEVPPNWEVLEVKTMREVFGE